MSGLRSERRGGSPWRLESGYRASAPSRDGSLAAWAALGASAGGIAGGLGGYEYSQHEIGKLPVQSAEVEWKEPILQDRVIGKIPDGEIHAGNYGGFPKLDETGHAVLELHWKTWSGHGSPVVTWHQHPIQVPYLDPQHPYWTSQEPNNPTCITPDCSYDFSKSWGWHTEYHPNVRHQPVPSVEGTPSYQTPEVHFETGVHVALNTVLGVLGGSLLGSLAAYLIHRSLVHRTS